MDRGKVKERKTREEKKKGNGKGAKILPTALPTFEVVCHAILVCPGYTYILFLNCIKII